MARSFRELTDYLVGLGVDKVPHSKTRFLSHLIGVYRDLKEWGWTKLVHPDDVEASLRAWKQSLETGEPFHCEQRFRRSDGRYCWHLSRALAMHDANGSAHEFELAVAAEAAQLLQSCVHVEALERLNGRPRDREVPRAFTVALVEVLEEALACRG